MSSRPSKCGYCSSENIHQGRIWAGKEPLYFVGGGFEDGHAETGNAKPTEMIPVNAALCRDCSKVSLWPW